MEQGTITIRLADQISTHTIGADGELDGELPEEVSAVIEEIITHHAYLLGAVEA
jgi:hypothetical protein